MSSKSVQLIAVFLLAMALPAWAVTNAYILKDSKTNQEILIIGLTHTSGNKEADEILNELKIPMAQRLVKQLQAFKKIKQNDDTVCFYECDAKEQQNKPVLKFEDVVIEKFWNHQQQFMPQNIYAYEPRSLWSCLIESLKQLKNDPDLEGITGEYIVENATTPMIPIKDCMSAMDEEENMISTWPINDSLKQSLLQENKTLKTKLANVAQNIPNAKLPHAFFEGELDEELMHYDYKLADMGFYSKTMETKNNVILVIGQKHADEIKKLLVNNDDYKIIFQTSYVMPPKITIHALIDITTKSCAAVEKGMAQFLFKQICNTCSKSATEEMKLSNCSRCKKVAYCSVDCQKKDWAEHKKNCQQQ